MLRHVLLVILLAIGLGLVVGLLFVLLTGGEAVAPVEPASLVAVLWRLAQV